MKLKIIVLVLISPLTLICISQNSEPKINKKAIYQFENGNIEIKIKSVKQTNVVRKVDLGNGQSLVTTLPKGQYYYKFKFTITNSSSDKLKYRTGDLSFATKAYGTNKMMTRSVPKPRKYKLIELEPNKTNKYYIQHKGRSYPSYIRWKSEYAIIKHKN